MIINVHAGHAATGCGASGAVGLIKESDEARKVKDRVITNLRNLGHTVYDCTVNSGTQNEVLNGIVKKCNSHTVDLDVSIHFNAGANRPVNDGITTGVEVLIYSENGGAKKYANNILNAISNLGFRNRGVKCRPDLYVLKATKAPALLIECCFVDDKDDTDRYNPDAMANAITTGITGSTVVTQKQPSNASNKNTNYLIQVTADVLNVRKGPGTNYGIATTIRRNYKFTIVEESNGWGKLKSGAGWICLKYTKRV